MLIYLSAGEHSGDMHAASLARTLRALCPDVELMGMGGPSMRAAGVELIHDPTAVSTIGFVEVLRNLGRYHRLLREVTRILAARRPDVVVWVDFGGFNLALARACRRLALPVVCVFSPSAWAYGRGRAEVMARCVTELAAVLPFEAEFYRSFGLKTTFVGHPLLDLVRNETDPDEFRAELGLSAEERLLALLPGSRLQEVERLLPVMLAAVGQLDAGRRIRPVLPLAPSIPITFVHSIVARAGRAPQIVPGRTYDVLRACDAAMIASGTATLEAAILGAPLVSIYRVSTLSYFVYKALRPPAERGRPISTALPNLVARRRIVPELLQGALTPSALAGEIAPLLDDPAARERMRSELAEVRRALGRPGAMRRVAEIVLRVAGRDVRTGEGGA